MLMHYAATSQPKSSTFPASFASLSPAYPAGIRIYGNSFDDDAQRARTFSRMVQSMVMFLRTELPKTI
jgi:hypothetical protein